MRLGLWVRGRKTTEVKCHSHPIKSRSTPSTTLTAVDTDLAPCPKLCCPTPPLWSPHTVPCHTLWKEVTVHSPHFRSGEFCSTSLRAECLCKYLKVFCLTDLSFLPQKVYFNNQLCHLLGLWPLASLLYLDEFVFLSLRSVFFTFIFETW